MRSSIFHLHHDNIDIWLPFSEFVETQAKGLTKPRLENAVEGTGSWVLQEDEQMKERCMLLVVTHK